MAFIATHYAVGTAAILVVPRDDNPQQVVLHNHEHANNHEIFLGPSGVTTATGLHLIHTETIQLVVAPGDELYAVSDGANRVLHVLTRNF
jgi:hypothetical protein